MQLSLLSRPTTETSRVRSPSPITTPVAKPLVPTIRLTAPTPSERNPPLRRTDVAPWSAEPTPTLAPKEAPSSEAPRKRLIPKKSKLRLLGSAIKGEREQDLSDVVRRVTGSTAQTNGFEIYVDPTHDPDLGEILLVKKKKSRAALNGMNWGTLEEVTNITSIKKHTGTKEKGGKKAKEGLLKVKVDENQKWWSIGRGKKDLKEKEKEQVRVKAREPLAMLTDSGNRFNSLDSGILLSSAVFSEHPKAPGEYLQVPTPPTVTLAPPGAGVGSTKDSVAMRAIRSVRSIARIGSWAQLRSASIVEDQDQRVKDLPQEKKKKKKKEKDKEKDKTKETTRYSGSSFEAGALTASPAGSKTDGNGLGKKKASILGLGLPSTMRLPSSRSGSTASSLAASRGVGTRLSVDSATVLGGGILARGRSASGKSTASSLRPASASSCVSGGSSNSSASAALRWDEAGLETVKENRRKERESRGSTKSKTSKTTKGEKDSRKALDSRKRRPLAAVFPSTLSSHEEELVPSTVRPAVRTEDAAMKACDHQRGEKMSATPAKRTRPMSEQVLGGGRPKAIYDNGDDGAVISLLDAATNDLAQLINRLDLEATPGSSHVTPRSHTSLDYAQSPRMCAVADSPVKALRANVASISSLRPYGQSLMCKTSEVKLGQHIAPWSTLNASISPSKSPPATIRARIKDDAPRFTHKRTLSPAPAADPPPVFIALRPATSKLRKFGKTTKPSSGTLQFTLEDSEEDRSPSSLTFGSLDSMSDSHGALSGCPVFKKMQGRAQKRSSPVPNQDHESTDSLPILPEARRNLGLTGTMGASVGSTAKQEFDASDPDSDIPDELQVILSNSDQEVEDTMTFDPPMFHAPLPSPGLPPEIPLPIPDSVSTGISPNVPVFRARVIDEDDNQADIEEAGISSSSEDDTKKSFDFTGEIKKLNESGASHRRSFVEQLENAFRTPSKLDFQQDFPAFIKEDVPPLPKATLQVELSRAGDSTFSLPSDYESRDLAPMDFPVDVNADPSLLPGTDSYAPVTSVDDLLDFIAPQPLRKITSVGSRPSDGQLNRDFKFGGKPASVAVEDKEDHPFILSDIIPRPAVTRSLSTGTLVDESALMKSIYANAIDIPSPRPRLDSESRSIREARKISTKAHQRNSSALSFAGFDSFVEVRRGFEFHDHRPGFYPPSAAVPRHMKHESLLSIASVSSYGHILNAGSSDPFDYGSLMPLPSLKERPSSDDFSFSMSSTVDDTFSFIHRQPRRKRVDSDGSSFYFRASLHSQVHPYHRSHRRHESSASASSFGPPVSRYNRSSVHHRRGDSSTSISSVAQSYAMCGASGGRAAWAKHRSEFSVDSVISDYSAAHLARPGLGDKMLDSAFDRGMPLTAISASPPESLGGSVRSQQVPSEVHEIRTSHDSVLDIRNEMQKTTTEDSLFDSTESRTSVSSSDSAFFVEDSIECRDVDLPHYRPISSMSIASLHDPAREDDTMITMLGGGHVRRCSIGSMIETSPCVRMERRRNVDVPMVPQPMFTRMKEDHDSPEKSRVIESKPSIASTSSFKFGDERMIRAKHGLLARQSLEDTVLAAQGEDTSGSFRMQPVFTRPPGASRSRSSTCTSSSGADTPPLSLSDGYSSLSEGSQSSIDLSQLNVMLANATHPLASSAFDRVRLRGRGHGHRRQISQARASRTSIYETIEEEGTMSLSPFNSPDRTTSDSATKTVKLPGSASKTIGPAQVFVVDPETSSVDSVSLWDDDKGITALRKYYALRDEAQDAVNESQRVWSDTPFSIFAVQSFDPPRHLTGMQALLEDSMQNYQPLPMELRSRRMRSRADSRPSPYPRPTKMACSPVAERSRTAMAPVDVASLNKHLSKSVLREVRPDSNRRSQHRRFRVVL